MTIASTLSQVQYPCNGTTTQWSFGNKVFSAQDLVATLIDTLGNLYSFTGTGVGSGTSFSNVATGLSYTIYNVDVDAGCYIVFSAAPTSGWTLDLRTAIAELQSTSIKNQGSFLPELHEEFFDKATRMLQDLFRRTYTFGIHGPDIETTPWPALPIASKRVNQGLVFDLNGLPTVGTLQTVPMTQTLFNSYLVGSPPYVQTAAEIAAGVLPTVYTYFEGDIRRYGALTTATDNSAAFISALKVSAAGGAAAYVPGTESTSAVWATTNPIVVPAGSSMYGAGTASVISVANNVDGLQFTSSDSGIIPRSRFFRDFLIVGTLSGGNTNTGRGIYSNASSIVALFSNVGVENFSVGMIGTGLEYSGFTDCYFWDCYQGMVFNNASANVYVRNCTIQLVGNITVAGSPSIGIYVEGSPEIEGVHIQGGSIYGFNYGMYFGLVFEVQIEAVDISYSTICPIYILGSTIGGVEIRDNWIELGSSASGSFNYNGSAYGNGNLCGIFIGASSTIYSKVHIHGNNIVSDSQYSGSCGVFIGNSNSGVTVIDNDILGFDVGVGGGASAATAPTGGVSGNQCVIKWNRINIFNEANAAAQVYTSSSQAVILNSTAVDCEVGPNNITPGAGSAATIAASANITVTAASAFPVGTPVQCTSNLSGGPVVGVTYYVISSSGTTVTIGAYAGATAIAWTGTGSIGSLIQTPAQLATSGGTSTGLTFFGRGQFLLTLNTGFASALTGICDWVANGKSVSINVNFSTNLTGTSNGTSMTGIGIPPYLYPVTEQQFLCTVENNGTYQYGSATLTTGGALTFYATPNGGTFTASGTKGVNTQPMTWLYS